MDIFKKVSVLALVLLCGGIQAADQQANALVRKVGKAVQDELTRLAQYISDDKSEYAVLINLAKQEVASMAPKIAEVLRYNGSVDVWKKNVQFLRDIQRLFATTHQDFMVMAEMCRDPERKTAFRKALENHHPKDAELQDDSIEARIALARKMEQVDLGDPVFNILNKCLWRYAYAEPIAAFAVTVENDNDTLGKLLETCHVYVAQTMAVPFVMFIDNFFGPGWKEELHRTADLFGILNTLCTQILDIIDPKAEPEFC